ncbi:hypothetical protein ILYODFUR_015430 [Ilyodon furcidens]|uniref:Uncharacterized protein n=1 Tax=Ilyodon furcidens TaxID=33524 RepID=A0ABV0TJ49_9TELE
MGFWGGPKRRQELGGSISTGSLQLYSKISKRNKNTMQVLTRVWIQKPVTLQEHDMNEGGERERTGRTQCEQTEEPAGNKELRPTNIQRDVRGEQRTDNQKDTEQVWQGDREAEGTAGTD